jgi:3-oxoacyl-[acyl-carrier protein] reductase
LAEVDGMKLKDRVALITGGGSGIGRATALLFAEEGARVAVNDLHLTAAEKTVQEMGAAGAQSCALAADVSDSGQVRAMFAEIERRYGTLDILVNNAGIAVGPGEDLDERRRRSDTRIMELVTGQGVQTHWDVTQEMSDEAWHRVIGVHLNGTFFCTREALRLMSRQNRGAIVNLSSVAALMGLEQVPHYSAAKGGILAFTRAVAREVGSRGIRVNAICPGYIDTPMTQSISPLARKALLSRTPLGRLAEPREVAVTALFLASDDSAFFTGQWLSPNGGLFIG